MHVLLNRDEISATLARHMLIRQAKKTVPAWTQTNQYLLKTKKRLAKTGLLETDFVQVNNLLRQDLIAYQQHTLTQYKKTYRKLIAWLILNWHRLPYTSDQLLQLHAQDCHSHTFLARMAPQLDSDLVWVIDPQDICQQANVALIRNVVNNEAVLRTRRQIGLPFWFIDSGYTNFLHANKHWHRLCQNQLHVSVGQRVFPADRLHLLPSYPKPWRVAGSRVVVVCGSDNHYDLHATSLDLWQERVKLQLTQHTDRPIEWRRKTANGKTRRSLYEDLANDPDVYCVISDSSAAAVEAVWLGIPIITLLPHITAPVARSDLGAIDNLYRGPVGDWLCAVSYSQFTREEMFNGTAVSIVRQHHA